MKQSFKLTNKITLQQNTAQVAFVTCISKNNITDSDFCDKLGVDILVCVSLTVSENSTGANKQTDAKNYCAIAQIILL